MVPVLEWINDNMGTTVRNTSQVGGSAWSTGQMLDLEDGRKVFVKTNMSMGPEEMFAGEFEGLKAMYGTHTIRVPNVYHYGPVGQSGSYIIMEHLNFGGRASQTELGQRLAMMHMAEPMVEEAKQGLFGFPVDNTIGSTPQPNRWTEDWVTFFAEQRIRHQCQLTNDGKIVDLGEQLIEKLDQFFVGVDVRPSILHGDLWSGNICAVDGEPTIFDPACYYGHHEAEFGMSWCANFGSEFYQAYHELIPKEQGYEERKQLYLLYHYLNHYNLFGGGYYRTAVSLLRGLVAL